MKVSVVIATYNGEMYISQQLKSIQCQLSLDDEILVIDDGSTDSTVDIVCSLKIPQLKIIINKENLGVVKTFEKGLFLCSGNIIFLADQDDIWIDNKVNKIVSIFDGFSGLVVSDARVCDHSGREIAPSFIDSRGGTSNSLVGDFFKNRYLGCTMAFSRDMLPYFTPIPKFASMHDIWFVLVAKVFGRFRVVNEPLIMYRRHSSNVTGLKPQSLYRVLFYRAQFILCSLVAYFRFLIKSR